ncbi:MAG: lytic transglycosylase domain-containing protein [Bacteroidales bacterium]|jgi:hypothetical protein|nr:lytic transglycosylase domain-containing protein [Bacteroidales bacterium]
MRSKYHILITLAAVALTAVIMLNFTNQDGNSDEYYQKAFQNNYQLYSPVIPEDMNFCGERVPLELYHVYERMDRELLVNVYWQSNIMLLIKRANRYFPIIEPILKEQGLPDDFKYLALAESSFVNVTSSAGAAGFWQFIKSTGLRHGLEINNDIDERYHLEKATVAAANYLKTSYKLYNNWTLAAAAYNTGDSNIRRHIKNQGVESYYDMHLPEETMRYVFRILALKTICENPQEYGIILRKKDLYPEIPVKSISVDTTIANLFTFATQQGVTYQQLRALNPWMRSSTLPNKSKKKYQISIPANSSLLRSEMVSQDEDENILQEIDN